MLRERWVSPDETVEVHGYSLPGMVYVGAPNPNLRETEPSLIDPALPVLTPASAPRAPTATPTASAPTSKLGLKAGATDDDSPRYSTFSPTERGAYLGWLSTGRRGVAPRAFVKLFVLGVERRIMERHGKLGANVELPALAAEIRGLFEAYPDTPNWLRFHVGQLATLIEFEFESAQDPFYARPAPVQRRQHELLLDVRLALGQAAFDQVPLPADWALAWLVQDSSYILKTPLERCRAAFDQLYRVRFHERFPDGFRLTRSGRPVTFEYTQLWRSKGTQEVMRTQVSRTQEVPLGSAVHAALQVLVDSCCHELADYSQFLARGPQAADSAEALLLLPIPAWPAQSRRALRDLAAGVARGHRLTTMSDLLASLAGQATTSKSGFKRLLSVPSSVGVGHEPAELGAKKGLVGSERVALFEDLAAAPDEQAESAFRNALSTFDLAIAISGAGTGAAAGGRMSVEDKETIAASVRAWSHLKAHHTRRLLARLAVAEQLTIDVKANTAGLKVLPLISREAVAAYLSSLTVRDGTTVTARQRVLAKICELLDVVAPRPLDQPRIAVPAVTAPARQGVTRKVGLSLDAKRIAAIQADSERATALLSQVFSEDDQQLPAELSITPAQTTAQLPTPSQSDDTSTAPSIERAVLTLDTAHQQLVQHLLTRPAWTRAELQPVAEGLDLMLDGALEAVNDAFFDAFNVALVEDGDPLEVNSEAAALLESAANQRSGS